MQPEDFLKRVWGKRKGYAILSHKDLSGGWHDNAYAVPRDEYETILPSETDNDVYFCPNLFDTPYRRIGGVQKPRWLYADLDPIDPRTIEPKPTIAWESSPERYQCLWRLDRGMRLDAFNDLNKRMTYHVGADKGGWDLTQVLRVPGTRNHKYDDAPPVQLMWSDGPKYKFTDLKKLLKDIVPGPDGVDSVEFDIPELTPADVFRKHRKAISRRAKTLLFKRHVVEGERSDRLWELENMLLSSGLTAGETFILIKNSAWNKYAGRNDETRRLVTEIQKAAAVQRNLEVGKGLAPTIDLTPGGWEHHDLFMQTELPPPAWMVDGIWSDRSHGIIAGEPKSYKSLIATEIAVAVASGCKAMGVFDVEVTGPVLIVQEENTPWLMQSRLRKIEYARGVSGSAHIDKATGQLTLRQADDVQIELLNQTGFDLTDPSHLEMLERKVQVTRPALIILDPLYMMLGDADENSVRDMRPILQWLLQLKVRYGTGIVLVHHYSKQGQTPRVGGQRMLGSMAFHGWVESALYIEKPEPENPHLIKVRREHRNAEPQGSIELEIFTGNPQYDEDYTVNVHLKEEEPDDPIWVYVKKHEGSTVAKIAKALGCSKSTVVKRATKLEIELREVEKTDSQSGRQPRQLYLPS